MRQVNRTGVMTGLRAAPKVVSSLRTQANAGTTKGMGLANYAPSATTM